MDMQIIISAQSSGSDMPLQLDLSGYHLEVSGLAAGRKLAVTEDSGRINLSVVIEDAQEVQPDAVTEAMPETDEADGEADFQDAQQQLFRQLVELRKQIVAEVKLPPYVIFHDATLKDMSRLLPADLESLRKIQGVGAAKLEKYGARFIEAIQEFTAAQAAGKAI